MRLTPVHYLLSFFLLPQNGVSALIWASLGGHDDVVEKLLAAGTDPNRQDKVKKLVTRVVLIITKQSYLTS